MEKNLRDLGVNIHMTLKRLNSCAYIVYRYPSFGYITD